jgi:hypothetical protein
MQPSNPSRASRATQPYTSPVSTTESPFDLGTEKPSGDSTSGGSQLADSFDLRFDRSANPSPSPPPRDTQTQIPPLEHSRKRQADFVSTQASVDSPHASDTDSKESRLGNAMTSASTGPEMGYIKWAKKTRLKSHPLPLYRPPTAQPTAVSTSASALYRIPTFDADSRQWKRRER